MNRTPSPSPARSRSGLLAKAGAALGVAAVATAAVVGLTTAPSASAAASIGAASIQPTWTHRGLPGLIGEAYREVEGMHESKYAHTTKVDEATGTFEYDCSGFLDYALGRVDPQALKDLPTSTKNRPLAGDIVRGIDAAAHGKSGAWRSVRTVRDLVPGDVVAWLSTDRSTNGDTGHAMIALTTAYQNPKRPGEWLLDIADSTDHPHAKDSRKDGDTGLGTGTIGLVTDKAGHPTAFYWRGGLSPHQVPTQIVFGRPLA
jgi:hypothetical protein